MGWLPAGGPGSSYLRLGVVSLGIRIGGDWLVRKAIEKCQTASSEWPL